MSKGKKDTRKNRDYIDEIKEWQEHQYDPGYYTGDKIPPYIKKPGNPRLLGWFFIMTSILSLILFVFLQKNSGNSNQINEMIMVDIFFLFIVIVQATAGIRMLQKPKRSTIKANGRKTVVTFLIILLTIIFFISIYKLNEHEASFIVDNWKQFVLFEQDGYYSINIKEINKKIKCTKEERDIINQLFIDRNSGKRNVYKIYYKWNNILPENAKCIKIEKIE